MSTRNLYLVLFHNLGYETHQEVIMEYSKVCSKFSECLKNRAAILASRVGLVCKEGVTSKRSRRMSRNLSGEVKVGARALEPRSMGYTLCDPMDYSLPGSSVHGIFQARVLEWGAIAFSDIRHRVV